MRSFFIALSLFMFACGGPTEADEPEPDEGSGDEDTSMVDPEPDASATSGETPHLRNCVLHAGGARGRLAEDGTAVGDCHFNAECFAEHGAATTPTDGFIHMQCENTACECRVTLAVDEGEGEPEPFVAPFTAAESCTTASVARALFVEHCMTGSELATD